MYFTLTGNLNAVLEAGTLLTVDVYLGDSSKFSGQTYDVCKELLAQGGEDVQCPLPKGYNVIQYFRHWDTIRQVE